MRPERSTLGVKIIFMGTPDYALAILNSIIKTDLMDVVAVYTQPDKPVGNSAQAGRAVRTGTLSGGDSHNGATHHS